MFKLKNILQLSALMSLLCRAMIIWKLLLLI